MVLVVVGVGSGWCCLSVGLWLVVVGEGSGYGGAGVGDAVEGSDG